jgi:hypothetical protein
MATTQYHHFIVIFAGAANLEAPDFGRSDRVCQVAESAPRHWSIAEDGQPVAMTSEQQAHLAPLLATLDPLPNPAAQPTIAGADGTWFTFYVRRGGQQASYRWWASPPDGCGALGAIAQYVEQIADSPRQRAAELQRQITWRLFDRLAARGHAWPPIRARWRRAAGPLSVAKARRCWRVSCYSLGQNNGPGQATGAGRRLGAL